MSDAIVGGLYQAAQFLIDDGYDKHENPIRVIEEGAAEITRLRDLVAVHEVGTQFRDAEITRLRALVAEHEAVAAELREQLETKEDLVMTKDEALRLVVKCGLCDSCTDICQAALEKE